MQYAISHNKTPYNSLGAIPLARNYYAIIILCKTSCYVHLHHTSAINNVKN